LNIRTEAIIGVFILAAIVSFLYMAVHLGAFRLDTSKYVPYSASFKDVSGLTKKADIKIAGVKVGWVDDVVLEPGSTVVRAKLMILRDYTLYKNAYVVIRQEGMLGLKFLEVIPGDPQAEVVKPGESLDLQQRQFVGLDEILHSFYKVAQSVQELSVSLKDTVTEVREVARQLKGQVEPLGHSVTDLTKQLHQEVVPHMTASIDRIVTHFESTCQALKQATTQVDKQVSEAGAHIKSAGNLIHKIESGQGTLGKLVHDDTVYRDACDSVKKVKACLAGISEWRFAIDSRIEPYIGINCPALPSFKGYINGYFYPVPHCFFLGGVALSDNGFAKRTCSTIKTNDHKEKKTVKEKRSSVTGNFQVGAVYKGLAVRFGVLESSLGVGIDWFVPGPWTWMTTLEAFDFKGSHRIYHDNRPHLKWLNRFFFSPYVYIAFGADDFVSKHNKSVFIGAGLSFQ
jgi:phospholipid/cholesterol/gamma-HCH transport system substrate-binding protein